MNENEFLESRLKNQIKWYSDRSSCSKKCFYIFRTIEIVGAATLTAISCFSNFEWGLIFPALSLIVTIMASLLALYKFQELWISYRTTSEALKHEKYLFLTKTAPYDKENRFNLLVENTEHIISSENSLWRQKFYSKEG